MRSSRGMGAINPSKMPKMRTLPRKDKPTTVIVGTKPKTVTRKDVKENTYANYSA